MDKITYDDFLSELESGRKDFSNLDLTDITPLEDKVLDGIILDGSNLSKVDWNHCSMIEASLRDVIGTRTLLEEVNLSNADLTDASFVGASFDGATLKATNFTNVIALGASFILSEMTNVVLLNGVFDSAVFNAAHMLFAVANNASFKRASFIKTDISGADFRDSDLTGVSDDGVVTELTRGWDVKRSNRETFNESLDENYVVERPKRRQSRTPKAPSSSSSGTSVLNDDGTIDITQVKKGTKIRMSDGWEGEMADNSRSRTMRNVIVNGDYGSTYCAEISEAFINGEWVEITGQGKNPMGGWRSVYINRIKSIIARKLMNRIGLRTKQ